MDNGLIFPYRRRTAHTEPGDAKRPKPAHRPFGDTVLVERVTRTGSR